MTTLDDAERLLDAALTRLEGVVARLSGWREAEAAADRRIAAAEEEADRRIGEAEATASAALAERDAATGELQGLRDRCDGLDRELAESREAAQQASADAARRMADLEKRLADSTAARERLAAELRQMEESATREVTRLDGMCKQLGSELAAARSTADRLDRAARDAAQCLQDALEPSADDV